MIVGNKSNQRYIEEGVKRVVVKKKNLATRRKSSHRGATSQRYNSVDPNLIRGVSACHQLLVDFNAANEPLKHLTQLYQDSELIGMFLG